MDKKTKYQQPNVKGAVVDAKKNQDVTGSKFFPKSLRRRESVSAISFPKNEQPRKSNTQKTKNFDKRSKLKGHYHGGSKEDSKVVESESAELGSVMVQGSKKQNLNHLLNFHYAPRDMQSGWNHGRTGSYNGYNRWLPAIQRHKYNKEQFLQANCQFVVTAKGDYSLYLNDPDALVDWKLIEQIRLHSSDNLYCPICLCYPLAGKMTRCGHVYCWSCILHYLALSNNSWRKCPICYESIHKSDLKSVVEITENALNIGDHISLRLMRREKGTLLAEPVNDLELPPPTTFLPVSQNPNQVIYSKLLLAQNSDIMDVIESERVQLNAGLLEDPDSPENIFIQQALSELLVREEFLLQNLVPIESKINENTGGALSDDNLESKGEETFNSTKVENKTEVTENFQLINNSHNDNDETKSDSYGSMSSEVPNNPSTFYFFYQADGGQNVYLHAMNVKMLEMQYGSLEKSPRVISGKIIEKEVGSFTADLRRRMRYLCHLPVTSQFEIVEIDLQPPTVSDEVLMFFENQIVSRQQKRKRREREERKREKKITEEENKRMGKYPTQTVHIESHKHFPQFQPEIDEVLTIPSPIESVNCSSVGSSPPMNSFDDIVSEVSKDVTNWPVSADQGPSFAEMLRTNVTKKSFIWPSLNSSIKENSEASSMANDSPATDFELMEYIPPAYNRNLGDALAQALENSDLLNHGNRSTDNVTSKKKKKKKGKATLLYATNMDRAL